jgi:hypothetical protein
MGSAAGHRIDLRYVRYAAAIIFATLGVLSMFGTGLTGALH